MMHAAKSHEQLWVYSMGKRFRVRAIADSDSEANQFMSGHRDTGVIACFGPFNVIANLYEGVRNEEKESEAAS